MADGFIMHDDVQEAKDVAVRVPLRTMYRTPSGGITLEFSNGAVLWFRAEGVILVEVSDRGDR